LAFVTSAFSSYSGCRQYRENIAAAVREVGDDAPRIDKLRVFFNHPGFLEPVCEHVHEALDHLPAGVRDGAELVFVAHSIPAAMAAGSSYEAQLREASRLVAERLGRPLWSLAYQSRSGPAGQPWLEPDICGHLLLRAEAGLRAVVLIPIGFLSDHMEVLYDLDVEARDVCQRLGLDVVRAETAGTHPRFVRMIRELIEERILPGAPRLAVGALPPSHDDCTADCCPITLQPIAASP
jgi:ferrochelatase